MPLDAHRCFERARCPFYVWSVPVLRLVGEVLGVTTRPAFSLSIPRVKWGQAPGVFVSPGVSPRFLGREVLEKSNTSSATFFAILLVFLGIDSAGMRIEAGTVVDLGQRSGESRRLCAGVDPEDHGSPVA